MKRLALIILALAFATPAHAQYVSRDCLHGWACPPPRGWHRGYGPPAASPEFYWPHPAPVYPPDYYPPAYNPDPAAIGALLGAIIGGALSHR